MPRRLDRLAAPLLTILLLGASSPLGASLAEDHLHRLKALQQQLLLREPAEKVEKLERIRKWRKEMARGRKTGTRARGRQEGPSDLSRARRFEYFGKALPAALKAITAPPNRLASDTTGEPDGSCQSEVSIAAYGDNVVATWNDGIGVFNGGDYQGYAYSTDGGLTWTDGGALPNTNVGIWSSDPVVVVNEKTGAFYFSALTDQLAGTNGIGVVKGLFSGGIFSWGTPVLAASFDNRMALVDKEWMAVDSLSGNLYVSYSHFSILGGNFVSDDIRFLRSINDGQTWSGPVKISAGVDDGYVQGSRPAVGPGGELYVVWHAIGQDANSAFGRDFLRIRKSLDQGASFAPQVTADSIFSNFPSGGPGFNRGIGITFPGIAVDRSSGPNRGRVYLTWNESLNFFADVNSLPNPDFEPGAVVVESESNNGPAVADAFDIGSFLRGTISLTGNPGDLDYWKWNATQGTTYFFYLDSLDISLDASFRIFCSDGNTNLAFNQNGFGGAELLVFTAPTTDAYYLRVASYGGLRTGKYRVLTTSHQPRGDDRARDHRDILVKSSDNGFTWNPTTRVNDDPGHFDDFLPEVTVDGFGRVFVGYYDWRDSPLICGGGSNVYLYRSDNGGASWVRGGPMSDVTTNWNDTYSTLIPNQGDYIGLFARDSTVYVAWGDGRNGDPDAYMTSTTLNCQAAPIVLLGSTVSAGRDTVTVTWSAPDGTPAPLFRRVGSGPYVDMGPVVANALNEIVYVDEAVTPRQTYGYRLGVTGFCEAFAGETSVFIPCQAASIVVLGSNVSAGRDTVTVTWSAPDGTPATLFRRVGSGPYVDMGPVVANALNEIVYVDAAVAPGFTYGYRLGVPGFCEQFAGETSVVVPGPELAIESVHPNPTPDDVNVRFYLESNDPATLALYDIAGREILRIDVGALGAGRSHLETLNPGVELKPGIYFVRLSQSGKTKEKRVTVRP